MKLYRILLLLLGLSLQTTTSAQSEEWKLIHKGNRLFHEKRYNAAGVLYGKALQINPDNARASYNLGNVRTAQNKADEALRLYQTAAEREKSPQIRSMAYHNRGYIFQQMAGNAANAGERQQNLTAAIAEYKQALRHNPLSEASRYNLALCQKQLKETPDSLQNEQQQQKQEKQEEQKQNEPLMNYTRQAEQQTRKKINAQPRQRSLEKNW